MFYSIEEKLGETLIAATSQFQVEISSRDNPKVVSLLIVAFLDMCLCLLEHPQAPEDWPLIESFFAEKIIAKNWSPLWGN